MNLSPKGLGLTAGIFCGIFHLGFIAISVATGFAKDLIMLVGSMHPWFSYTYLGAIWMGVFHFVVVGLVAALFAWVYNKLV